MIMRKKISAFLICATFSTFQSVKAQDNELTPFEKDGFGVEVQSTFRVECRGIEIVGDRNGGHRCKKEEPTKPGKKDWAIQNSWSVGAGAFYTLHPLKALNNKALSHFFTRFGLGGEFQKYDSDSMFLFNAKILLGYNFRFGNFGIDVFTGPTGRFAPKKDSYNSFDFQVTRPEFPGTPGYETRPANYKTYYGSMAWTVGVNLNFKHIGVSVAYNAPLTDMEHYSSPDHSISFWPRPQFKSMTVGLHYFF